MNDLKSACGCCGHAQLLSCGSETMRAVENSFSRTRQLVLSRPSPVLEEILECFQKEKKFSHDEAEGTWGQTATSRLYVLTGVY